MEILFIIWYLIGLVFCGLMTKIDYDKNVPFKQNALGYILAALFFSFLGPIMLVFYLMYKEECNY